MGNQLVQAQWSLNETSDSVYGIARGVLQAATSDNVQPLAIMACEQFGNTLAISRETRLRIERTVLPTPEPVTIQFLKAKVGFMKHDCAVQLGSNQAGLRFLALAAALISSVRARYCAEALMLMLEDTTSDRRLLPTTRHLTDLMDSLQGRCRLSGFADIVFGYNSILMGASRTKGYPNYRATAIPESKALATLVDACRHLQRVGDHELSSVIVESASCAAWVAAFSKWSLELPPSIYFADGTAIFSQPESQFTIIFQPGMDGREGDIKITKRYKLDSIQDLVVQSSSHLNDNYHVQFKTYCEMLSSHCGNQRWARDAILAALPFTINRVREMMGSDRHLIPSPEEEPKSAQDFTMKSPDYYPSNRVFYKIMRLVFDLGPDFPFDSLASAKSYRDLPEVNHYFHMSEACSSVEDAPFDWSYDVHIQPHIYELPTSNLFRHESNIHSQRAFIMKLSIICSSLFSMSLFDNIKDLYFAIPGFRNKRRDFTHVIERLISKGGNSTPSSLGNTLNESFRLLWDVFPDARYYDSRLVISTRTHVFWFSIFDDFAPKSTGVLWMSSCRGRILHERETYTEVVTNYNKRYSPHTSRVDTLFEFELFYPKLRWELDVDLGTLCASLSLVNSQEPKTVHGYLDPISAIKMLKSSVLVNCKHRAEPPGEATAALPKEDHEGLKIFLVSGVGALQMYGLGWIGRDTGDLRPKVVIQQGACVACCIKACKMVNSENLLL
ncbi:hypothetical protein F4803DRAFT_509250 [Xylaria telfairii]|nr:hypothetical protein F4803DRAFT_509250 [Xylaria telfairii]